MWANTLAATDGQAIKTSSGPRVMGYLFLGAYG